MKCPKCGLEQFVEKAECPGCGIIFSKYALRQQHRFTKTAAADDRGPSETEEPEAAPVKALLKDLFLYVKPEVDLFSFVGRALLFVAVTAWGLKFIFSPLKSNYAGESFMHLVNLPFHEAGHLIFSLFGRFIGALGGSLMQLLVPLICMCAFLLKTRDTFGASVSLWWAGESLIDLAPYINDARELRLILLGGVTGRDVDDYHDWEFILRETGLLQYDHVLAKAAHAVGAAVLIAACAWGGYLLYRQFRCMDSGGPAPE